MRKGGLLLGLKAGVLALCLAASIPFSVNAATVVKPDGTGLDESKMTQEEKEGYELTKKYSKTLPKINPNSHIPSRYFSSRKNKLNRVPDLESKYISKISLPVKDQNITGTCWCFSMLEASEQSILSKSGAKSVDLSEYQESYFIYNQNGDKLGLSNDSVEAPMTEVGGIEYYSLGATVLSGLFSSTKGVGLIDENDAKFTDLIDRLHDEDKAVLSEDYYYNHNKYTVSGIKILDTVKQRNEVKQYIKEYGAAQTSYMHYDECFDYSTYGYYHAEEIPVFWGGGHAVAIVGWDDNYSKDNFAYSPEHDGAWLIKNSWGDIWGLDGYFWMSYDEPSIGSAIFFDLEEADSYDNIYQYDGTLSENIISGYLTGANVFEAQNDEILGYVSFFTVQDKTNYEVSIYKNPANGKPNGGTLLEKLEGSIDHMGYTKLKLKSEYKINKGEKFSVVVKQTVDGKAADIYCDESGDLIYVKNNSVSKPGESYASKDGNTWEDLSASGNKNLRIKAFTRINESVSGSNLSFEKDIYELKIDETVATKVKLDGNIANGKAKFEYSIDDDEIASVDSRGLITGKIAGETTLTVKYKDNQVATTTIKVDFEGSVKTIKISKKSGYATKENPLAVSVGSMNPLEFTVTPKTYKNKVHFEVEALSEGIDPLEVVNSYNACNHIFYKEGLYKVIVSIEDQGDIKGSSEEFYINAKLDSINCGSDISKIAEEPYEPSMSRIYRFSDPDCEGYRFTIEGKIEEGYDFLLVAGLDDPERTDQEIFDGLMTWDGVEGVDLVAEVTGDLGEDYTVTAPYKYVAFLFISDETINGNFKVTKVEPLILPYQISMNKADLTIEAKAGENIEKQISILPEGASLDDIYIDVSDSNIADASFDDGKLVITPNKVGSTTIILGVDTGYDDETDFESEYEEDGSTISGAHIKITVNVTSGKDLPDHLAFVDEDNDEITNITVERNAVTKLGLNSDAWEDYQVAFYSDDLTTAYIDGFGELIPVSAGTTKIRAEVSIPGESEDEAEVYSTELKVRVTLPDENDINNLQTLHEYVRGTDEVYTYTDTNADTECMNIYFDARSSLDMEDYITIQDGKGYFYGFEDGHIITKWSQSETKLSDSFRFGSDENPIPSVLTIYDKTIKVHLVSKEGERLSDDPDYMGDDVFIIFMGSNKQGINGVDDPYRTSYGFSVKRIETGAATKEISVEDMELDFSTYRTFDKRLKVTVDDGAIDKLYYVIDDPDIAYVSSEGVVTGMLEGETTCRVFTANPDKNVEAIATINIGSKPLVGAKFYKLGFWGEIVEEITDNPAELEIELGYSTSLLYRRNPWNASQNIRLEVSDEDGLYAKTYLDYYGDNTIAIWGGEVGEYTLDVFIPNQEEPIQTFNVKIVEPKGPEVPEQYTTFDPENFATDGNDGIDPTEITEAEIKHMDYDNDESIYWTYKREGAEYVDITFAKSCELERNWDWIYIYDLEGNLIGHYTGDKDNPVEETCFAGKTIRVPGEGFILALVSDDYNYDSFYGFKILDITPHFKKDEPKKEEPKGDEKKDDKKDPTATPTPTTEDKTPQIGQSVVVGKATYKILTKDTVAYVKSNVKNPKSASVPATVKISGKTYKVTEISANAFKNKKKLKKVTVGKNVKKIGKNAFYGCKKLKKITIKGKNLKSVGANAIKGINKKAVIKVPKAKLKVYKKLFKKKTGYKKTMKIKK
ncbi:MAG: leucine-rich repeat protein [Eubacterium sp.]|nr:leucine-rich repeat protein [Eubacterium sp.]